MRSHYPVQEEYDQPAFFPVPHPTDQKRTHPRLLPGRILCVRTSDGGKTFSEVSYIREALEDNEFMIMPASLQLDNQRLLSAVRCRGGERTWIDMYA